MTISRFYIKEWFDAILQSLSEDSPVISDKFVLMKVKCGDPTKQYSVFSDYQYQNYDQKTNLNIFKKGWKHENTEVSILHPNSINKSIQIKEDSKNANFYEWLVNTIPEEYIGEDGYFIISLIKKEK